MASTGTAGSCFLGALPEGPEPHSATERAPARVFFLGKYPKRTAAETTQHSDLDLGSLTPLPLAASEGI